MRKLSCAFKLISTKNIKIYKNYFHHYLNINRPLEYKKTSDSNLINVMSFNMKRNYTKLGENSWKNRVQLIVSIIQSHKPDVIGTQELTLKSLNELKSLLPEYSVVGQGRGGETQGEYTAIFYLKDKFTLKDENTFWLSKTPNKPSRSWFAVCPRICTTCTLGLKTNPQQLIRIFNTHLDHISSISRKNSLKLISKKIEEKSCENNASILLMGDFNTTQNSKAIKSWIQEFSYKTNFSLQNAYNSFKANEIGRSFHGFKGKLAGMPIDYIFASNTLSLQKASLCRENINNHYPSDHYPVLAKYVLSC